MDASPPFENAAMARRLRRFAWLAVILKKGFKLVILAVAAVAAFFKKLFGRLFGGQRESTWS